MIPAACQGIIAIECRSGDLEIAELLADISDPDARRRFDIERSVFCRLKADCKSALGVHAEIDGERIVIKALMDEKKVCLEGSFEDRRELCEKVLQDLTEGV